MTKSNRVCYWNYFGQMYTEPRKEFLGQRKDMCKGPEAGMCSVLESRKAGMAEGEWETRRAVGKAG